MSKAALAKTTQNSVEANSMFNDADGGFENSDAETFAVPYILILQKTSPYCDEDHEKYLGTSATPGNFLNSVSQKVYPKNISVIPCYYNRVFIEWAQDLGGFKGVHLPDSEVVRGACRDNHGKFLLENGNYLQDTRQHFCLVLTDEGPEQVLIPMASTQIKKSRQWMTIMRNIKFEGSDGKFTPPMFSHIYTLATVGESNEYGNWKGYKIEMDRILTDKEADVYAMAKDFKEQLHSGALKAAVPAMEEEALSTDM